MGQNLPCSLAARPASAAPLALLWKGSGWLRKTIFTLSPYASSICLRVGTTREQNGHWKSDQSTIVTFAPALPPLAGESEGTSTLRIAAGAGAEGALGAWGAGAGAVTPL